MEAKYYSFLLRMWTIQNPDGTPTWKFSLESSSSGDKFIFNDLIEITNYLTALTNKPPKLNSEYFEDR